MRKDGWDRAEKVLCVRLDSMGDVLMTTPAIRAVKESSPGRHVVLLTSPSGAAVAKLVPEIDDVIIYEAPWIKSTATRSDCRPDFELIERIKAEGFDGAIVFNVCTQNPLPSAFLCYMAGIPLRLSHCHENPYQLLTHWVPDPEPTDCIRHEVQRQIELVATIGCRSTNERLSLRVPDGAYGRVITALLRLGVDVHHPWVVMHTGASAPSRRYPADGFAQVARRLVDDLGHQVLFTGVEEDRERIAYIQSKMEAPSFSLAGELDLGEMAALLALSPILVSNNTGPVHIAAATGTPVVDLYALTNPQHTPWKVPQRVLFHDVPHKYCYKSVCPLGHNDCLRLVPPEAVVEATQELLEETATLQLLEEVVA